MRDHTASIPMEDYLRMEKGYRRYEYVRTLSPQGFSALFEKNIKEGVSFDLLVDLAVQEQEAEKKRRWQEEQKRTYRADSDTRG